MRDGILFLEDVNDGSTFPMRLGQLAELVGDHLGGGVRGLGKDRQAEVVADLLDRFTKLEVAVAKYNRNEDIAPLVELHHKRVTHAEQQRVSALEQAVLGLASHAAKQAKYLKWLALVSLAGSIIDVALISHVWR